MGHDMYARPKNIVAKYNDINTKKYVMQISYFAHKLTLASDD